MTTTKYPVNSTTCPACKAIGGHTPTCTAARPATMDYGCPDWCVRDDHDADEVLAGEQAVHYGPEFWDNSSEPAMVYTQSVEGSLEIVLDDTAGGVIRLPAATQARRVAAALLSAAEWMEARA